MTKSEARQHYRKIRKAFTQDEVNAKSDLIFNQIQRFDLTQIQVIHVFLPIAKNNEINTYPLIHWLFAQGKRIVVPIVEGEKMLNAEIQPDFSTELKSFDIPEPIDYTLIDATEIDLVFTPLFVADKLGNRVGYGGGFYDRFFGTTRTDLVKVGLTYFEMLNSIDDLHNGDVSLDVMVSPTTIESFTNLSSKVLK